MLLFGTGMGRAGIDGATRRTDLGAPGAYMSDLWVPWFNLSAIGGVVLLISAILLYVVLLGTWFNSKEPVEEEAPILTEGPASSSPALFERWTTWIAIIIISNAIMWAPVLIQALDFANGFFVPGQPGAAR